MGKNKKKKQNAVGYNDQTAFSKSDWFGPSRKSRQKRRKKNKNEYKKPAQNKVFIPILTGEKIEFIPFTENPIPTSPNDKENE